MAKLQSRTLLLIFGTVASVAVAVFLDSHPAFVKVDESVERELLQAVSDMLNKHYKQTQLSGQTAVVSQVICDLIFGTAGAAIGYKANSAKLIIGLQLLAASVILMALAPLDTAHAVQLWLSALLSFFVGSYTRNYQKQAVQAQQLTYELKVRNQQLEQSEILLVKTDETDRRIFAADLHDRVLNDIKLALSEFNEYKKSPDDSKARKITELLNETMSDMRNLMDELNPVMLECFGLAAALEDCADTFTRRGGFKVKVENEADAGLIKRLNAVEQQLIYRLVQESLTNAYKHAEAKIVIISLTSKDDALAVKVSDDGKGMSKEISDTSRGLKYMRMRAAIIGATVNWSAPDKGTGTVVQINMPVH